MQLPLVLFRRQKPRPESDTYPHLLTTNAPLTDEERTQILAAVRNMEGELHALMERNPTGHVANIQATSFTPKRARKIAASISRLHGLLSAVRNIPCEVWQKVFRFTMANVTVSDHQYGKGLSTLCSVSRMWNLAATTERSLWTVLPNTCSDSSQTRHASQLKCMAFYLERSGSLPIDVAYTSHTCAPSYTIRAGDVMAYVCPILAILLEESPRWRSAGFDITNKDSQLMKFVEGRIPRLETLRICIQPSTPLEKKGPFVITLPNALSEAPSLRHVDLATAVRTRHSMISLSTPRWLGLQSISLTAGFDVLSVHIIQMLHETLSSVEMVLGLNVYAFTFLNHPIVLPRLTKLVLHIDPDIPAPNLLATLSLLAPPSLEELRIFYTSTPETPSKFAPIFSAPLGVWKSPLKQLWLDHRFSFDDALPILDRCPELEALDIQAPTSTSAGSLFQMESTELPPSLSYPRIPLIQTLTLRGSVRGVDKDESITESELSLLCKIEACSIGFMIMSRTVLIPGVISPQTPQLKTINFIQGDGSKTWHAQLEALNDYLPDSNGGKLPSVSLKDVEEFTQGLRAWFLCLQYAREEYGRSRKREMDGLLKRMEKLDLSQLDSRPLVRKGVLVMLCAVSRKPDDVIPGDKRYRFRERARELCIKWKPFVIRDAQVSPFRWIYMAKNHLRLKYDTSAPTEKEIWEDIFGPGATLGHTSKM
ncbi:hypothetical protein DFP72DRAFT_904024 [Ephemerocybe angulata]|uniref:F-box domain-containing protein n=1 Tax=Ephemerocybe angulata TaxID=980116 RepID=A0A8H6M4L8_9AGAR|nr:hypothetical protein DFP72DRAFT_904024 [Tulosesus angulatus]